MYLQVCGALSISALILNLRDFRMLVISMMVVVSIFVPVPSSNAESFYTFCVLFEILVAVIAWATRKEAGFLIANACVLLVIAHVMGYSLDGSVPLSPYHVIVKILELVELGICVALSPVIAPILRNQDAPI